MKLNTNLNQQDLESIFINFDQLNNDFKKIAREILKIEADKNLLSKPSIFIFSIINRAIALNKGFKSLAELNNYVAAINFLRL